jgi:ribose 5-phosphate isomerase B
MTISEAQIKEIVRRILSQSLPSAPEAPTAANTPLRLALGADHGGFELKEKLKVRLADQGHSILDCGTHSANSVDYPDFAYAVAQLVAEQAVDYGIVIDGAGIGSCMAANKVPGIRAAMCYDEATAKNSREHNHANVLTLGARMISEETAEAIVAVWLATPFGPDRHAKRVEKIMAIERRYLK